jgi:hypothetical protein
MTKRPPLRAIAVALLAAGLASGCNAMGIIKDDPIINDDWGIAGYARLQGTVSHANGSRFGSVQIYYFCGDPEPTWFGNTAMTSADGSFDIAVDAPMAGTLPRSGTLVCEVRLASPTTIARAMATTAFSQSAATRPVTVFTLVEGQGAP